MTTMSENVADLVAALAKFQGAITPPPKLRTVEVRHKDGGRHSYNYAELDVILEHVKGPFSENGFAWTSWIEYPAGARPTLITRIYHSSGQWIQTSAFLTASPDPKQLAGEITYWRRYSFCMLLGIASQEDSDDMPPNAPPKGRSHAPDHSADRRKSSAPQVRPNSPPAAGAPDRGPDAGAPPAQASSGPQPGSGVGSGTLNSDPLKAAGAGGLRMAGPKERQHVAELATAKGWSLEQVLEYIGKRYEAAKLSDLFMPQYNDLVAVVGTTSFEAAMKEIGALPVEGAAHA